MPTSSSRGRAAGSGKLKPGATVETTPRVRHIYDFDLHYRFIEVDVYEFSDSVLDTLYEAGCDDATIGTTCGRPHIGFSREAPSFRVALISAIADVEKADVGLELIGVTMRPELDAEEPCAP